jgi:ABC-2 type transport system ATP-binding protein
VLCGLLLPSEGKVSVADVDVLADPAGVKARVGYMSQRFTLYDDLTAAENLNFAAALRRIPKQKFLARKKELLDFVGFTHPETTLVRDLPGGVKQMLALVVATLHSPEVIFLDEPTAGVSPAARAKFWNLIKQLAGSGKTIFVTTHYMDEAEQCGRIVLMRAGQIIALGSPAELKRQAFPVVSPGAKAPSLEDVFVRLVEGENR